MKFSKSLIRHSAIAAAATAFSASALSAQADDDKAELEMEAKQTLERCAEIVESCAAHTDAAAGVLVFPEVWKADLIVGGAGGDGVLMVDGDVQGHYDIGKASIGLQAGIDESSIVYIFRDQDALDELDDGDEWEMGAAAGATVITADANAMTATGDPLIYVLDAEGLNAELSVNALRIWEDDDWEEEDDMDEIEDDLDDMDDSDDWDDDDEMEDQY